MRDFSKASKLSMAIKVGDRVRFLNAVGDGRVVRMLDKRTAMVETDDGFEIPTLCSELVVVTTNEYNFAIDDDNDKRNQHSAPKGIKSQDTVIQSVRPESKPLPIPEPRDPDGDQVALLLGFVPADLQHLDSSAFEFYLINDSPYRLLYSISVWEGQRLTPLVSGEMLPDTKEMLKEFSASDFAHRPTLNVQAIYLKNTAFAPHRPEYFDYEINPLRMLKSGAFVENDYFDERALVFAVADSQREQLMQHSTQAAIEASKRQKDAPQTQSKPKPVSDLMEVDLHAHEVLDSVEHLSPGEILCAQLSRFEVALETALRSKTTRRVVFIHGVGNGKLKYEITKILDTKYPKLRRQDASFKEYGYGATMVYLR